MFEAAARLESFTAAAAELGLTQAAVSYQVRQLEDRLGLALFRREKRRVVLTEPGRRAAMAATRALDDLDAAFAELRSEDEGTLTISASTTFANEWLAWRLGGFQMAHPGMAVRLVVDDAFVDLATQADVAIRRGFGDFPGLTADLLIRIEMTPMASPGFLARHGRPAAPADLLALPLASPDNADWGVFLAQAGVAVPKGPIRRGVSLASQANDGNAAMAGQAIALLTPFFWRNALDEGRLVRLFDQLSSDGRAYWLVAPAHRRNVAKIKRFRDWLLAEIER